MEDVRPRRPWWLYGTALLVLASIGLVAALVLGRSHVRHRAADIQQILAITDEGYQRCALGEVPPPAELGIREIHAQLMGKLTVSRARSCAEIVQTKLAALDHLQRDDKDLASFFSQVEVSDGAIPYGVGVCSHVASQRRWAKELGVDLAIPDCSRRLEILEPIVQAQRDDLYTSHAAHDRLALDVWNASTHTLKRTRDGKTWDESPVLRTTDTLHVAGADQAFAYAFASEHENARYHVYDGKQWHAGALVVGGDLVSFTRSTAGWTIAAYEDVPTIVRLDPQMDHVLAQTPIPALRGRWSHEVERLGIFDDAGDAAAVRIEATDKGVSFESHFVPAGGKPQAPLVRTFAGHPDELTATKCTAGATAYVVIGGIATLVTTDGGRSFTEVPGGNQIVPTKLACTAQHLFAVSPHSFVACDHAKCILQDLPVAPNEPVTLDLATHGEQAQVFVAYRDAAMLLAPRDSGELAIVSAWRWDAVPVLPIVRIGEQWFVPRE